MKKSLSTFTLSMGLLLAPLSAQAQDVPAVPSAPPVPEVLPVAPVAPVPPVAPAPAAAPFVDFQTVYVGDNVYLNDTQSATALKTKIALDVTDVNVKDAIKRIADQVKIPVEFADDVPANTKVTMTLKNVSASDALRLLTREANLYYRYSKSDKDGKKTELLKVSGKADQAYTMRAGSPETVFTFPSAATINSAAQAANHALASKEYQAAIRSALTASRNALRSSTAFSPYTAFAPSMAFANNVFSGAKLPDTRIKIDARNARVRDVLKDILKQADLPYALEDDLPDDIKRSFTFENIPIATALDVITGSVNVGWRAERQKDGKALIRIGKKYVRGIRTLSRVGVAPNVFEPGEGELAELEALGNASTVNKIVDEVTRSVDEATRSLDDADDNEMDNDPVDSDGPETAR